MSTRAATVRPDPGSAIGRSDGYTAGMDGADWLRAQLTSFGCAACGLAYGEHGIRVLAERDGLFFVDLACDMCGSSATAIVTVALDDELGAQVIDPELVPAVAASGAPAPLSLDDVLDVHQVLSAWQGDLVGLLRHLDGAEGTVAR